MCEDSCLSKIPHTMFFSYQQLDIILKCIYLHIDLLFMARLRSLSWKSWRVEDELLRTLFLFSYMDCSTQICPQAVILTCFTFMHWVLFGKGLSPSQHYTAYFVNLSDCENISFHSRLQVTPQIFWQIWFWLLARSCPNLVSSLEFILLLIVILRITMIFKIIIPPNLQFSIRLFNIFDDYSIYKQWNIPFVWQYIIILFSFFYYSV